jgi:hypothetical protein
MRRKKRPLLTGRNILLSQDRSRDRGSFFKLYQTFFRKWIEALEWGSCSFLLQAKKNSYDSLGVSVCK